MSDLCRAALIVVFDLNQALDCTVARSGYTGEDGFKMILRQFGHLGDCRQATLYVIQS